MGKTRDIAPGMRKTFDQPTADRIDDIHENNRDCPGQALKGNIDGSGMREGHVGAQSYDLSDISTDALDVAPRPAMIDLDIAAYAHGPAELPQIIKERGSFSLRDRIVFKPRDYHADPSRPLGLLRACEQRACGGQSGNKFDEIASSHCFSKTKDRAGLTMRLDHGFALAEMGLRGPFASQQSVRPNVRFGSFTAFLQSRRVRFAPRADIRPMPAFMRTRAYLSPGSSLFPQQRLQRAAQQPAHSVGDSLPVAGLAVLEFAKTLHQIEELAVDLNWINCRPAMEPLAPTSGVGGAPLLKSDGFLNHGPSVVA